MRVFVWEVMIDVGAEPIDVGLCNSVLYLGIASMYMFWHAYIVIQRAELQSNVGLQALAL